MEEEEKLDFEKLEAKIVESLKENAKLGHAKNLFESSLLPTWASHREIDAMRRKILRTCSPDFNVKLMKEMPEQCVFIRMAWEYYNDLYDILLDTSKRKAYLKIMDALPPHGTYINTDFTMINLLIEMCIMAGKSETEYYIKKTYKK